MKIGLSSFWCSQFLFELSKTSSDGTAWENLQDVSVMSAVVVIFDLTGGFSFHCFTTSSLTLPWAIAGSFTPHFVLSAHPIAVWFAITFILTFLGFSFLPRVLRFWVGIFFPHVFFTLHSFVCDSGEGRNTPSRVFLCACPHRVVSSGWRMGLNCLCLNYKTIDLSIAPVSH